jgi:hypothetical protein
MLKRMPESLDCGTQASSRSTAENKCNRELLRHATSIATLVVAPGAGAVSQVRHLLLEPIEPTSVIQHHTPTLIVARVALGAANSLFIRGEGGGLSWNEGQRLGRVAPDTWIWLGTDVKTRIVFQLLLDDTIWARGERFTMKPGERQEIEPDFEWPEIPLAA